MEKANKVDPEQCAAFWERVIGLAKQKGMTISALAEAVGWSRTYIAVMRGRGAFPAPQDFVRLAAMLEVPMDYLLLGSRSMVLRKDETDLAEIVAKAREDSEFRRFIRAAAALSPEKRKALDVLLSITADPADTSTSS